MLSEKLRFEDLPKATEEILKKLEQLKQEVSLIKDNFQPKEPIELLTRQETADFLKINISTLWHWTRKGRLTSYGIGNRVYYKRSEVEKSIIKLT